MKKYIITAITIIILGIIIILVFPFKANVEPIVVVPQPSTVVTPAIVTPIPAPAVVTPVPSKSKYVNKAAEYYLGNWGKTPIKDRGDLAK